MTKIEACLEAIAQSLFQWEGARRFQASDVLIWQDGKLVRIAFRGDALKIERNVYSQAMFDNHHNSLDLSLQRALGLTLERDPRGFLQGGLGQTLDDREAHFGQVLEAIDSLAREVLAECSGETHKVIAVLMPHQGEPIHPYYSAKKKKWLPAGKAPRVTDVQIRDDETERDVTTVGAQICELAPHLSDTGKDILATGRTTEFFVGHATTPRPEGAQFVKDCGGWLYPSLGVGITPSISFGPLFLVAGVELVLFRLKPYLKKRGARELALYDTDVWTITARDLALGAHILYRQLIGTWKDSTYGSYGGMGASGPHQWVLGAPSADTRDVRSERSDGEGKIITSTKQLATDLRQRRKVWRNDLSPAQLDAMAEAVHNTKHRYPYLEAKANFLLEPSGWQLAVVPKAWEKLAKAYLKTTGVTCPLLTLPDPEGLMKDGTDHWPALISGLNMHASLRYSGEVSAAIVSYATTHGLVRAFEE